MEPTKNGCFWFSGHYLLQSPNTYELVVSVIARHGIWWDFSIGFQPEIAMYKIDKFTWVMNFVYRSSFLYWYVPSSFYICR